MKTQLEILTKIIRFRVLLKLTSQKITHVLKSPCQKKVKALALQRKNTDTYFQEFFFNLIESFFRISDINPLIYPAQKQSEKREEILLAV